MPVAHFTPWDGNWPFGPPMGAEGPTFGPYSVNNGNAVDNSNQLCEASIIGIENQSLSESVPLAGTPFSLVYQSTRTPGYVAGRTLMQPQASGFGNGGCRGQPK